MKSLMRILLIALFIGHLSCTKDNNDLIKESIKYRLEIKKNQQIFIAYEFTEKGIQFDFYYNQGILGRTVIYNWNIDETVLVKEYLDSDGIKKRIDSLFYNENGKIDYMLFYAYSTLYNDFINNNHYQFLEYNSSGQLIKHTDYDSTHHHYLTLRFEYDLNGNISKKYYPLETGLPQDSFVYDNKTSIYRQLNLPEINELAISKNNITKIYRRAQSTDGFDYYLHEFVLYQSTFIYDASGIPTKEIRLYSDSRTDTLTFDKYEVK